jgi:predicted NBD/HSP70 family sugar kinase
VSETQVIYDIIRRNEPVARIDISTKYRKRPATVTRITNKLLKQNLICSCGKEPQGRGRSPELLKTNPDAFYVLGVHAVTKGFLGSIVSAGGRLISCLTSAVKHKNNRQGFLNDLKHAVEQFLEHARESGVVVSGIGLALPGEVDYQTGCLVQAAVILPELTNVPCKKFLQDNFHLPVVVDHDGAMMTLGEFSWGSGKNSNSSMGTLFIGHGIGGRFIINGKLFRGGRNRAGELGHIPLRRGGPLCKCGLRGCFEALASIPVIEKNYSNNVSFEEVVSRAKAGEKRALEVLDEAAEYTGEAIAVIFDIIDVDMLVINGEIIIAESLIKKPLLKAVMKHSHSKQPANKEFLTFSKFGREVGTIGAAAAAVQNIYAGFGITNN